MKNTTLKLNKFLLCFLLLNLGIQTSFAQNNDGLEALVQDTKNDMLVVVGGGLAGAVLGLSTLSFVDEPKDHTRNIIVGASIGIIAGVAYVAFTQANKSREAIYGGEEEAYYKKDSKTFSTATRVSWHQSETSKFQSSIVTPYSFNYAFNF